MWHVCANNTEIHERFLILISRVRRPLIVRELENVIFVF